MAKFFQRRNKTGGAETTPIKVSSRTAPDTFLTPSTVDLSMVQETPASPDEEDANSEEPWDVQQSFSEDAGSEANSNTTPTPVMRRTIQDRMSRLREEGHPLGDEDNSHDRNVDTKMLRGTHRSIKPLSPPADAERRIVTKDAEESRDKAEVNPEDLEDMPEDEKEQYLQALGFCGLAENGPGAMAQDNLCDYTMSALNEFCGAGPNHEDSHNKPDPAGRAASARSIPRQKPPYGVEEQTAIEVEYIEPERRQDVKSDVSSGADPQTKHRLVQAMARRAKQDFETKKGKPAKISSPTPLEDIEATKGSSTPDNVYSSFSSAEKRLFLKLINSGLTPSDATAQVLKEREEEPAAEEDTSTGKPPFWTSAPRDPAGEDSPQRDAEAGGEQFAKSGIGYYDGIRKDPVDDVEDAVSDDLLGLDRRSRKNRIARLAKFGFGRPQAQQIDDDDDDEHDGATRDPPPGLPPAVRAPPPPPPPKPINTARSVPNEDVLKDLDAVAESRSVFKPISPHSPEPDEVAGHSPEQVRALLPVMSSDSLFDDDEEQPESENEIVVPAAPERGYAAPREEEEKQEITPERREEDIVAARLLGRPRQAPAQESPPRAMITDGLDLGVETAYMNSTELMSQYNGNSVMGDQTVRTHGTYATTGTNYTTSTRSRRPGAVKQRLSSQKTGESGTTAQKYKGWQASIQEAAAGIGKVWDPVKGWVGYTEPEDEKKDDRLESIPVEYRSVAAIPEQAPAPSVSYPERATASSISSPEQAHSSSVSSPDSLAVLEEKDSHPAQINRNPADPPRHGVVNSKKGTTTPVKSRGWMETMKEATAKLTGQGKRWDPDRGWIGSNDDGRAPDAGRYRSPGAEGQVESDTQDFGTIQLPKAAVESGTSQHEPLEPSGQKPLHYLRQDPSGDIPQYQPQTDETLSDHHSAETSLRSGATGRYIQLGDSGSVSSYYYGNQSSKTTPSKERVATLESTPETKDEDDSSSNYQPKNTLLVNVKKEKVDSSEAGMFPDSSKSGRRNVRSTGPVDLDDDDDDQENTIFADEPEFSWDEDDFGSFTGAKKKSAEGKATSSSSVIPRLPAPKRDTSPIRGRGGSTTKASQPSSVQRTEAPSGNPPITPIPSSKSQSDPAAMVTPPFTAPIAPTPSLKSRSDPIAVVTPSSKPQPAGHGPDRSLKSTPAPVQVTPQTPESSPSVNNVKELHQYWEKRSVDKVITPPSAEWKSFLSKKVMAENTAAENRKRLSGTGEDDRDTLFDFGSEGAYSTAARQSLGTANRNTDPGLRQLEQISNLSPIRTIHDDDDDDDDDDMKAPSEVSTEVVQGKTFMERIQACAAPMIPRQLDGVNCNPMPLAHLNFMRRNSPVADTADSQHSRSGSGLEAKILYGKPDVIVEEDEEEASAEDRRKEASRQLQATTPSKARGDVSSVISDEQFGQKTAYLEAIAMKAAVSGSKKTRRTRSSGSEASGSNIKHSESWQRFLDKKNAATSEDQESVQRAAEDYATKKIDQMMARNRPAEFEARSMEEATGAFPSVNNVNRVKGDTEWKTESTRAAEDLAAARVEAMMHALSSPRALDEEEGEI